MRFMMIVKGGSDYEAGKPPNPELMAAVAKAAEEQARAGILLESGGLLPSAAGARVRVKGGKLTVIDGPFSEAKELIGGFAILKASSKAEAIEMGRSFMELHARILGSSRTQARRVRALFQAASTRTSRGRSIATKLLVPTQSIASAGSPVYRILDQAST